MCLHPLYCLVILVYHSVLLLLNLSHKTADSTIHVYIVLSLMLIPCSLITFISILSIIILKLLVKLEVYKCMVAHSTQWSKNHRMSEVMAIKRKSPENHRTQDSGDDCCDKYSPLLDEKALSHQCLKCYLNSIQSVIYSICFEFSCEGNKVNSWFMYKFAWYWNQMWSLSVD